MVRSTILTTGALVLAWAGAGPCEGQTPPTMVAQPVAMRAAPPVRPAETVPDTTTKPKTETPNISVVAPEGASPPTPLPIYEGKKTLLPAAKLEAGDAPLPITLATALRLANARPLVIAAAQAGAWTAEAEYQRALTYWLPQLNIGGDYVRHDGFGPDFNRGINSAQRPLNQNINFFYGGIGLIYQGQQSTEVIFASLAARQTLKSRQWDIQTAKNDALLQTATAYFNVHKRRGMYAGALDAVKRGRELVKRVEHLSTDLVPRAEVNRSRRALADLEQAATSAREEWRVASADLTQVLRLDPRVVVVPLEHDHLRITLVDPAKSLDELIPIGLTNRPELASQQRLVQAALVIIRQEKMRPLIPSFLLNGFQTPQELIQFGAQGIGSGGKVNLWSPRNDFSPQLMWQLDGLGFGNLARIKASRGEQSRRLVELFRVQDRVAADVTRTQARVQSAAARVLQAERSLKEALITFEKNYEGLRQTTRLDNILIQVYRPQEAVVALESLMRSYDNYFITANDYNRTQFEMFHALGYPAQGISINSPVGGTVPVDTSRPGYLPGVRTGPPPATR